MRTMEYIDFMTYNKKNVLNNYSILFLAIVFAAVAVRGASVIGLRSYETPRSTYEHGEIAANLLEGKGFSTTFLGSSGPTSQQAPIYPALVASSYAVGGSGTPRALLILELGQAILGGVLASGTWRLTEELAPGRRRAGAIAALVVAALPTLVYAATHVQVALLATTLLVWSFALAYRCARTDRPSGRGAAGAALGILVLTDPILVLAAPALVWIVARGSIAEWRRAVVFGLVACGVVSPWLIRNYRVHREFVFVKSTFGYAFWQGNCALSEGTDKVVRDEAVAAVLGRSKSAGWRDWNESLWKARHVAGYIDDIALTPAEKAELGRLNEPERSRRLFRKAIADLRAEPSRYPRLCLRRLRFFLFFDETNPKTRSLIYRSGRIGLFVFGALGWLFAGRSLRRRLGPTGATAVLLTAFHALTIVSARFQLPLEPFLAIWGSLGIDRLARRLVGDETTSA